MASEDHRIVIVGCGPGSARYLTPASVNAVRDADVLVGAPRLLALFPGSGAERIPVDAAIDATLDAVAARLGQSRIAVLVSGDPGIFSLAAAAIKRFGRDACRVIPGISSVQAAFAAIGLDWANALIISAHKSDPTHDSAWSAADKIAVLGGRSAALTWIANKLLPALEDRRVFVCEDLTLEGERVREVSGDELKTLRVSPQTVVLIIRRSVLT